MANFTYQQSINGGLATQRKARRVPFDPSDVRIFPLQANVWEKSWIEVDRVFKRLTQYDIITTGNQRQKTILKDGVEIPPSNWSEFFEGLRVEACRGYFSL